MPRSASASAMRRICARSSGFVLLAGAQELRGDRRVDRLAPADVVEVVVALERLQLRDLGEHRVDLRRRRRLADRGPEHADVELAAVGEVPVGLVVLRRPCRARRRRARPSCPCELR